MAKKAKEPTQANKDVLDARQKVQLAKDADEKNSTDKTKAHLKSAQEHLAKCVKVENRERFIDIAGNRVKKIRAAIRNLSGVANPRSYDYSAADVGKAKAALQAELDKCIGKLENALTRGAPAAKAEDDFTF